MGNVEIGIDCENAKSISITGEGRTQSTYVIGITGTGKSTLLENMAYQDMKNGDGLCFLDPHEESAERLLAAVPPERAAETIYWDPKNLECPFGLNPFYVDNPHDRLKVSSKADNFVAALASLREFAEVFRTAPLMKSLLQHLALTFIVNQGSTLAETVEFLTDADYRRQFYPALSKEYPHVVRYWQRLDRKSDRDQEQTTASSLNKLERFQSNLVMRSIFGQPRNSIDFQRVMDEGQIVLVALSGGALGQDNAGIIGAFVVWEILQAALTRHSRRPFHLFADEFQTFMTTALPVLQAQARKFGVDTTVAHQVSLQLDSAELRETTRAVGNLIIYRVIGSNAHSLAYEFDTTPPSPAPSQIPRRQA
jgi:hypothetical protein